jgi:hypothetical protein
VSTPERVADERVAAIRVDSKEIELRLFKAEWRDRVCDALVLCRVRPLNIPGRPKPPHPLLERTFSTDRLKELVDLAEKHPNITLGTSSLPQEVILSYARKRVACEQDWAARNPEKFRTVRIYGAGEYSGYQTKSREYWAALRTEFSTHSGESVSAKDLSHICWTAIEKAMSPKDFSDLQISLR